MLGWILLGIAAAAFGVIVISGIISKSRIKDQMQERDVKRAIIVGVNRCTNTVKLKDLKTNNTLEIKGDGIDDSLREYDMITA